MTVKRTMTPCVGWPAVMTVAVTVCCVPTGLTDVDGVSVTTAADCAMAGPGKRQKPACRDDRREASHPSLPSVAVVIGNCGHCSRSNNANATPRDGSQREMRRPFEYPVTSGSNLCGRMGWVPDSPAERSQAARAVVTSDNNGVGERSHYVANPYPTNTQLPRSRREHAAFPKPRAEVDSCRGHAPSPYGPVFTRRRASSIATSASRARPPARAGANASPSLASSASTVRA